MRTHGGLTESLTERARTHSRQEGKGREVEGITDIVCMHSHLSSGLVSMHALRKVGVGS